MKNRFYDNEFEEFLKDQANQHRMYPSDQVWRSIQDNVHEYRKWPALTVIAVFIIVALVVGTVIVKPHTQLIAANTKTGEIKQPDNKSSLNNNQLADNSTYASHLTVENITRQTIAKANETIKTNDEEEILIAIPSVNTPDNTAKTNNESFNNNTVKNSPATTEKSDEQKNDKDNIVAFNALKTPGLPRKGYKYSNLDFSTSIYNYNKYFASYISESSNGNKFNLDFDYNTPKVTSSSPFSKIGSKTTRLDFQFYLTPSISYRRLVDDANGTLTKSYITALPLEANYVVDLNRVIQHRPAAGYEIGFAVGYNLNKKFALRTGLQFNTRQYNIDAFVHISEPATIALTTDNSNYLLNTVSGFRNIQGSEPIELKNRYYEIALPIGIDWRPINKKFAWGISASIQPTYTFDKEPFIITSNYKNYADGSQLMRNWNLNANIETYLGYNTGKYRWQLGPQIRYQVMPTMANSYPIREYPIDFGIKLGLIRSLK